MPDDGLTNDTVASTYTYLLYVSSDTTGGGIDDSLKVVKGGDGTQTPLWIGDTTVPYVGLTTSLSSQNDLSANGGNSIDWNTAFGWGDHSSQGYLTSFTETDPIFVASEAYNITSSDTTKWDTAESWGDHAGLYLSSSDSIHDLSDVKPGATYDQILRYNGTYSRWEATDDHTLTTVNSNSGDWEDTATAHTWLVANKHDNWDDAYNWSTDLISSSASWDSVYTTVSSNSANWSGTYTTLSDNSGSWLDSSDISDVLVDGDFTSQGLMKRGATEGTYSIIADNSTYWNIAYGWGDHDGLYLTSFTETDPIFIASDAYGIDSDDISNWNSAYTALTSTSSNWDSAYTALTSTSSNWDSAYTTVSSNSASWLTSSDISDVIVDSDFTGTGLMKAHASSDTYSVITDNSSDWNDAYLWGDHDGLYLTDISSEYLGSLSDVNIASETDLEVLKWDSGSSEWVNSNVPLYSLSDVDSMGASSPSEGQLLGWDSGSSYWTPSSVSIPTQLSDLSDIDSALSPSGYDFLVYNSSTSEWTTSAINASNWNSVYTTVSANSGSWGSSGDIGVDQYIYHNGDANTYLNFTDDRLRFNIGGISYIDLNDASSAPHDVTFNDGSNDVDFIIKGGGSNQGNPLFKTDASTNRVGINGVGSPEAELEVDGTILATGSDPRIGIGTTSPGQPLTVAGNISGSGIMYAGDSNSTQWDSTYTTVYDNSGSWGSGGSSLTVQDEGSSLTTAATILDFVGAGVTATGTGATKTITIPGGGGSGGSGYWSQDSSTENIYYSAARVGVSDDEYITDNFLGTMSIRASGFGPSDTSSYSANAPLSSYALTVNGTVDGDSDYQEQGIAFRVGPQLSTETEGSVWVDGEPGSTTYSYNLQDNVKLRTHFESGHSYIRSSEYHTDYYGASVKIFNNSTGLYMVVGAPEYEHVGAAKEQGLGFIYSYNTSTSAWDFDTSIFPSSVTYTSDLDFTGPYNIDAYPGNIGSSIMEEAPGGLAAYDTTIVAAAPMETVSGLAKAGKVWIFELAGGSWSEVGDVVATSPSQNGIFGTGVAIYGDHIVIGEPETGSTDGSVHFVKKSGGTWPSTPDQTFTTGDDPYITSHQESIGHMIDIGDLDGTPVAFVCDGRHNPQDTGKVFVFTYSTTWSISGVIDIPSELSDALSESDQGAFGSSVSYDGNSKRLALGAQRAEMHDDGSGYDMFDGAVCVYDVSSTGVSLYSILEGPEEASRNVTREGPRYGTTVSLSGNLLAVGAPGVNFNDEASLRNAGASYLYALSSVDSGVSLPDEVYYSDASARYSRINALSGFMAGEESDEGTDGEGGSAIAAGDCFGFSTHIYENHLVVGAPKDKSYESTSSTETGSVYHYLLEVDSETTGGTAGYYTAATTGESLSAHHMPGSAITHERTGAYSQGHLHIKTTRGSTATSDLSSTMTLDASGNVGFNCYPDTSDSNNPWIEIDGALVLDELSDDPPTPDSGKAVIWYDGTNINWKDDSTSGTLS